MSNSKQDLHGPTCNCPNCEYDQWLDAVNAVVQSVLPCGCDPSFMQCVKCCSPGVEPGEAKAEEPRPTISCECGSEKVGSPLHSPWCPRFEE